MANPERGLRCVALLPCDGDLNLAGPGKMLPSMRIESSGEKTETDGKFLTEMKILPLFGRTDRSFDRLSFVIYKIK